MKNEKKIGFTQHHSLESRSDIVGKFCESEIEIKKSTTKNGAGFTLLEILLVVAAIAILAGIVIVAINPGKQLGDTRNSQRWSDLNAILNATYQYSIDNNGAIPSGITGTTTEICNTTDTTGTDCADEGFVDLGVLFDNGLYITDIPSDPQCETDFSTCYTIEIDNNRVTVDAPDAEQSATITVSK